jgi:hypothetical protein
LSQPGPPPSKFLNAVINGDAPVGDAQDLGGHNLARLIALTHDDDLANRDWATMLLGQLALDRQDVRGALLAAAGDLDANVRAEAINGLAMLDRALALPLLLRELAGPAVSLSLLEAAARVAHPSLIGELQAFANTTGDDDIDRALVTALVACMTGEAAV